MAERWPVQLLTPYPAFPRLLFGRSAVRSAAFPANDAAGGQRALIGSAAGTGAADVAVRTHGELTERVHNVLAGRAAESDPSGLIGSYAVLHRRKVPVLDPMSWPELAERPEAARETDLLWVAGESLTGGGEVFVPACVVYLAHRPPPGCAAPLRPGSAGLSAHHTRDSAARHAALEVFERDLLWRAWYGGGRRTVIPFSGGGGLLHDGLAALGLSAVILLLPGPGGTACVVACLHDETGAAQSFGARALLVHAGVAAAEAAVRVAVFEALMVRWSLRTPAAAAALRRLGRSGWHEVNGPLEHALYAFHRQDGLARLLTGGDTALDQWPAGGPVPPPVPVGSLLAEHTCEDVVLVDTVAPDARWPAQGTDVVRVVAPGARRLPTREPLLPPPAGARDGIPHPLG